MFSGIKNQIKPFQFWANQVLGKIYKIKLNVQYIRVVIEYPVYWFDSILEQVTFNNIVTVINPFGVLIPAVCFPVESTKHCAWQDSCIASTHRCRTGCIRSTTTLYHFKHVRWSNAKKYGIIYSTVQRWSGQFAYRSSRMKAIMMKTGFIKYWTHRRVVMLLSEILSSSLIIFLWLSHLSRDVHATVLLWLIEGLYSSVGTSSPTAFVPHHRNSISWYPLVHCLPSIRQHSQ